MIGPTAILGGAIAGLVLIVGAYVGGRVDGQKIALAAEAKAERAADAQRREDQAAIDAGARAAAAKETIRQTDVREIRHEVSKIIDRPVYRDICVDGDGVQLLERAAAVANGAGDAKPAVPAGDAAGAAIVDVR